MTWERRKNLGAKLTERPVEREEKGHHIEVWEVEREGEKKKIWDSLNVTDSRWAYRRGQELMMGRGVRF